MAAAAELVEDLGKIFGGRQRGLEFFLGVETVEKKEVLENDPPWN